MLSFGLDSKAPRRATSEFLYEHYRAFYESAVFQLRPIDYTLPLTGRFNIYNALGAMAIDINGSSPPFIKRLESCQVLADWKVFFENEVCECGLCAHTRCFRKCPLCLREVAMVNYFCCWPWGERVPGQPARF